jgi:actin-related protein
MASPPSLICDNGSGSLKLGYGGDNFPRHHVPCIIGRLHERHAEMAAAMQVALT